MEWFARWALTSPKFLRLYGKHSLVRLPICLLIEMIIPLVIIIGGVWLSLMS